MEAYYIYIDEFKKTHTKDFLNSYADIKLNLEKRFFEYTIGRYLVKTVAKQKYEIEDTEIILNEKSKPIFKNADLYFNISHSKNIVIACFDKNPCGIDIEYMKTRDLPKFSNYYSQKFNTQEDFYKFWTYKEASYKLQEEVCGKYITKFQDDYYLAIVSNQKFDIQNAIHPFI